MGPIRQTTGITVVGIGADGWSGVPSTVRDRILAAEVLLGGRRHLDLVPAGTAVREEWPSPLPSGLDDLLDRHAGKDVVALASGDPLVSGIGTTLIRRLGGDAVEVIPAISSVALARARMGWSAEECETITVVGREIDALRRVLTRGRKLVVLVDGARVADVATLLEAAGFGNSRVAVLSHLGAADESRIDAKAAHLTDTGVRSLSLMCVEVDGPAGLSVLPGLDDSLFEHDGQLSKRTVRLAAVCALAPRPGELLWDVGAGAGSVGIEWARTDPRCRTLAIEKDERRAGAIERNAAALGVPSIVRIVRGAAPAALVGLPVPDAIFVGGGGSREGVIDTCWDALPPGGRLVAHAVTLETEAVLVQWWKTHGGELTRLSVEHADPIGTFTGWRAQRPVVQWSAVKGER
ncbi:precorrin-6Y C5,15-methyltransferase [Rhodococcus pyridinivorans SB3094]|uniref:Precorrin-6Y C5,15-methyltransferase n=1 Tax=Rhodococcus pyridinivorans SB3094 TaxID=1435356 RepID=V9XID1_9NOCA|nr:MULTISPECIES: bifunctional cobalt-precorrin-7 (C(5))-methyltransferase/cobalt-precorrin-6B (C(15))-methyltransferase [Rhodococcus]AHD21077.1 precorrin-6Y C5,15-methyltransferase [Rhodococcus pyridinivorans SB3094]AHD21805.1 precorrin-6Y C5,15-methyltransferase [Rhodococcus pyridinivorans SB3094]MCT7292595.1 bifunctional cobalt-precorrin-7 (C(5))-methyltransferase/cobalt-precorrin-6B (C(15))-methyltransferase [Rhodococcus sp. PAE-6]